MIIIISDSIEAVSPQASCGLVDFMERSLQINRLFLRTHLLLKAKPELMGKKFKMQDGSERSLADVPDHGTSGELYEPLRQLHTMLSRVDPYNYPDNSESAVRPLMPLFQKVRHCFFLMIFGEAYGLYVPMSGFQHSCRPNAAFDFQKKTIEDRAIRDIAEGEPVTIHFVDMMKPKAVRQSDIKVKRGMTCNCDRCQEGDQENEVADWAAHDAYRMILDINPNISEDHNVVISTLTEMLRIFEKYMGVYHPQSSMTMLDLATELQKKPFKSQEEIDHLYDMTTKLQRTIPLTHGKDHSLNHNLSILLMDMREARVMHLNTGPEIGW